MNKAFELNEIYRKKLFQLVKEANDWWYNVTQEISREIQKLDSNLLFDMKVAASQAKPSYILSLDSFCLKYAIQRDLALKHFLAEYPGLLNQNFYVSGIEVVLKDGILSFIWNRVPE